LNLEGSFCIKSLCSNRFSPFQGKGVKSNPREVATKIVAEVSGDDVIEKLDVAGPGFVNIFVKKSFIEKQV